MGGGEPSWGAAVNISAVAATPVVRPRSTWSADEPTVLEHDSVADELLAIRCLVGEPDAFDELVSRWHEPLWR